MRQTTLSISALVLALAACATQKAAGEDVERFGGPIAAGKKITVAALLADPKAAGSDVLVVEGYVRKVCAKKGCWMEIADSADAQAGCRVTFKDYGFFVPKDSAGSTTRLSGVATLKVIPKDHVDHLEAEGAHFARKLEDGSAEEVQFVATGVEIVRPGS